MPLVANAGALITAEMAAAINNFFISGSSSENSQKEGLSE
jgi:hypothetical protein